MMAANLASVRLTQARSFTALPSQRVTRRIAATRVVQTRASSEEVGTAGLAAAGLGLIANPIVLWSLYTLQTTGAGLQGDVLGGLEGVSYLVVLGLVAWSAKTKVSTGSGLPAGPAGVLGAAEGFSYLSLLGMIVIFGLKYTSS